MKLGRLMIERVSEREAALGQAYLEGKLSSRAVRIGDVLAIGEETWLVCSGSDGGYHLERVRLPDD